jgi:menaquinone-dependent protoporphyrinogen oxidase
MRSAGCDAQARLAAEVDDLSGYAAVVLGSAVYAKRWRRGARSFRPPARRRVARHARVAVQQRVVRRCRRASERTDATRRGAARGAVGRAGQRHVRGRVPTDPGNFVERAMLKNTPPERRDARDWAAIEEWARAVAAQVAAQPSARTPAR